jgi:hypothetical protein
MSHFRDFWRTNKGNMAFIDGNITSMYYLEKFSSRNTETIRTGNPAAVAVGEELPDRAGVGSNHPSACMQCARGNRGGI